MNAQSKKTFLCSELTPISSDSSESSSSNTTCNSNGDNNGRIESSTSNSNKQRKMNSSNSLVQMLLNPKTAESTAKRATEDDSNGNTHQQSLKRHRRSISQEGDLQLDDVIHVPKDYKCLEEAIEFANQEFQRSRVQGTNKTITILIDPSRGTLELQSPLEVNTGGEESKLILTSAGSQMASLLYETRIPNQPLLKLVQGRVELENLSLEHSSSVDLITLMTRANHNAAVVVSRPPVGKQQEPNSLVSLRNVVLRSYTGKGIINHSSYCKIVQDDLRIFNPLF